MDLGLKDRLVVVTGGGAGIGAAISRACLEEGAHVVVLGRPSENVQAFMAEMQAASANCNFIEAHLEDLDRCRTDHLEGGFGKDDLNAARRRGRGHGGRRQGADTRTTDAGDTVTNC